MSFCYGHTREHLLLALASKEPAGRQLARMNISSCVRHSPAVAFHQPSSSAEPGQGLLCLPNLKSDREESGHAMMVSCGPKSYYQSGMTICSLYNFFRVQISPNKGEGPQLLLLVTGGQLSGPSPPAW